MATNLRSFTDFVMQSRLRALAVTFFITFIPILGALSIVLAGLVTLRKGAQEGFWVTVAATLPYFILLPLQPVPIEVWATLIVTTNVLTWLFASILSRFSHWSLVLEVAALIGIVMVAGAHIANPNIEDWWGKQLNSYLTELPTSANDFVKALSTPQNELSPETQSTEPDLISFVNMAKPFATGAFAASLLLTALAQLLAARWWQRAVFSSKSKKVNHELHHIHYSQVAGAVFLVAILLSYLRNPLALDMLPVLYLAFCVAGLSLAHYAFAQFKSLGWLWLLLFYCVLVYSWVLFHSPLAFVLIAMAGLLDIWFDCREWLDRRFS